MYISLSQSNLLCFDHLLALFLLALYVALHFHYNLPLKKNGKLRLLQGNIHNIWNTIETVTRFVKNQENV